MKLAYLLLFSLFVISCSTDTKEINSIDTKSIDSRESELDIDQEIIETIPDSLMEVGGMEINYDSTENTLREIEPVIITEEIIKVKKEKVEIIKTEIMEKTKTIPVIVDPIVEKTPEPVIQIRAEIHKTWDDLLKKNVSSSGKVHYAGFVKDKDELLKYIKELQSYHKDVNSWSKNKRLAYWINVYNAVTVKLITDNYPLKSIKDLNNEKPWDLKLINLGGTNYTLNVIENKIIRPKYYEPRIHFAVNCAAKSCPKIMNKAWTEDNIQRYLTKQTKAFLANEAQNTISADKVELSNIFNWYKVDFGGDDTKLIEFINKYSDIKVNPGAIISYKDYNWKLNN